MIQLALCITELDFGGAEKALSDLAVRIDKTRFNVVVYVLQSRPINEAASCVGILESANIPVRFLNMKGASSFFSGFFKLRKFLKTQKPDILLTFLFHANFLGRLAAYSAGVPHVVAGIRVAEKNARWHLTLDRWTSRFVEKYVCVSQSVADFSVETGKLPKDKMVVIPNGIDASIYSNRSVAESFGKKKIIFIGRLNYQKGLDWLIKTTPKWLPELPDWELLIVGEGPERQNLLSQLQNPEMDGFRDRIRFLGWRKDVPELLATSNLLVLPSRWEGMPNVILQAMAAGLPVVTTEVEGVAEILRPLSAEQTCRFGKDNVFSERILQLSQNAERRTELGRKNRQRIVDHFSLDSTVKAYEALFERLFEKNDSKCKN